MSLANNANPIKVFMSLANNANPNSVFMSLVSDLVNRGISTVRKTYASLYDWIVYKRGSKARERKGEQKQRRSKLGSFMRSSSHVTAKFCQVLPVP
jgi:hypothetical protein